MPPKKQKMHDIRSFFSKTGKTGSSSFTPTENTGGATSSRPGGATGSQTVTRSQVRMKEENDGESMDGHLHHFTVKFSSPTAGSDEYKIDCVQPSTVLEAIKSITKYKKLMFKDENIVIQMGEGDKKCIIATHFPCCCISEGETLIISCESEKVEEAQNQQDRIIQSRNKYSVFYIDTVGGLYTKQKKLFRNNAVKQFKYLCVYGEKGMTVKEALKRDGRFIDGLDDFDLSDNQKLNRIIECKRPVTNLDDEEFKIRLPKKKRASDEKQQVNQGASSNSPQRRTSKRVMLNVAQQRQMSVRAAEEKRDSNVNIEEIYEKLRQQFPDLKKLMESRFPKDSYQKELDLRKENFGKIEHSFSEVHRVRKLIKLGESVCKVVVEGVCEGTGFVLFDNFILTNAHILEEFVEGQKLKEGTEVFVLFNYEDPEPHTNYFWYRLAHPNIFYSQDELDYAILEINPEEQTTQTMKVPPGLLKIFAPTPPDGAACIIGHPKGKLKKMDPICIIEKEKREQAVNEYLGPYKDHIFIVHSISHLIKEQGIENIMSAGSKADKVVTYNTFMYHGASGSPVFNAHGKVFGLHTAGYVYGFPTHESVIECAYPLLLIFKDFVSKLKKSGNEELLTRVEKEAKGNSHLKKILSSMASCSDEPADSDEPMQTD